MKDILIIRKLNLSSWILIAGLNNSCDNLVSRPVHVSIMHGGRVKSREWPTDTSDRPTDTSGSWANKSCDLPESWSYTASTNTCVSGTEVRVSRPLTVALTCRTTPLYIQYTFNKHLNPLLYLAITPQSITTCLCLLTLANRKCVWAVPCSHCARHGAVPECWCFTYSREHGPGVG